MNKIWFSADHHFGHDKVREYTNRPFESVGQMDIALMQAWNEVVGNNDIIYHLGDFCFGKKKEFVKYASRLKGQIRIIPGNHDKWISTSDKQCNMIYHMGEPALSKSGYAIRLLPMIVDLKPVDLGRTDDIFITLCHYPMRSWNKSGYGAYHLYGHVHGADKGKYAKRTQDVGVDAVDGYAPIPLTKVLDNLT